MQGKVGVVLQSSEIAYDAITSCLKPGNSQLRLAHKEVLGLSIIFLLYQASILIDTYGILGCRK